MAPTTTTAPTTMPITIPEFRFPLADWPAVAVNILVGVGGGGGGGDPSEVETTCGADSTLTSTPPLLSAVWSEAREARMPDESAAFVEVAVASSATAMTSVTATEAEVIVRLTLLTSTPAVCAKTIFRAVLLAAS